MHQVRKRQPALTLDPWNSSADFVKETEQRSAEE
jgi:hypothetical protein